MADGHGVRSASSGLNKGKSPEFQASGVLFGSQEAFGVQPNAINQSPMASPLRFPPAAMAANGSTSAQTDRGLGVGPSALPPQNSSEAFPPLSRPVRPSQAKLRRDRAEQRRPYRSSSNHETAISNPGFSNTANSNFSHQFSDAWQGNQAHSLQPMGTRQLHVGADFGVSSNLLGGGHVSHPTFPTVWQYPSFQSGQFQQSTDPRHVAAPRAPFAAIQGNIPHQMGEGHVSAPLGVSFPPPGFSLQPPPRGNLRVILPLP